MTDDELAAITARAEAATPGPWWDQTSPACFRSIRGGERRSDERYLAQMGHNPPGPEYFDDGEPQYDNAGADAEFIVHARTDVPALLAEVERLRAFIIDRMQDWPTEHVVDAEKLLGVDPPDFTTERIVWRDVRYQTPAPWPYAAQPGIDPR